MMIAVGRRAAGPARPRRRAASMASHSAEDNALRALGGARRVYGRTVLFLVHACGSGSDWCARLASVLPLANALSSQLICFWSALQGTICRSESDCSLCLLCSRNSARLSQALPDWHASSQPPLLTPMRAPRSCALLLLPAVAAWRPAVWRHAANAPPPVARRRWLGGALAALAATTTARSNAYSGQDKTTPKAKNLPPKELAKRVEKDLVENQCGPGAVDGLALPPRRRRREDPSQVPRDREF